MHIYLTSALDGVEWSASYPDSFTPGDRVSSIHCIGGWLCHRVGLDDVEKKSSPYWDSNADPSVVQPVASRYSGYAIPTAGEPKY
jgi:hypothetical protein